MARLHRTQVLLERDQYAELRKRAAAERVSLSRLIRRLLRTGLGPQGARRRPLLRALAGAFSDPGLKAHDIDKVLYDLPTRRRGRKP